MSEHSTQQYKPVPWFEQVLAHSLRKIIDATGTPAYPKTVMTLYHIAKGVNLPREREKGLDDIAAKIYNPENVNPKDNALTMFWDSQSKAEYYSNTLMIECLKALESVGLGIKQQILEEGSE